MDRYIGKLLDNRYEIQEVIGFGGMAVVYKALCHRLNRPVAIKILKDELSSDEEFRRRFHGESQAVAMLSHPNIVSVYDVSHTEDADYIVMELIDGITLKQYMEQKGVLNWRETLHFGIQICKALEHAHSRGLIHRDIKPHNIMILKDGSVKVADFGIARVGSSRYTMTGEALGSVHYISPEQAKGGKMDFRADLYSLGVVLYEMLTGRPPYDGDTPVSVAIQHISGIPESPRKLNPNIPEGLEQIILHAMETDLASRYPSASQMLQDLENFRMNPEMRIATAQPVREETVKEEAPVQETVKRVEEKKKAKKKKKKRNVGAVIAAILCIGLALTGLVYLFGYLMRDTFSRQEDILVPDLYGMFADEAQHRYGDDFNFELVYQAPDGDVEEGRILGQKPKAEMPVKKGSTITITVSSGSKQASMPNVVNYSLTQAKNSLEGMHVKIMEIQEINNVYPKNYVIRTEPEAGTLLQNGQEVILYVSLGSNMQLTPVPKLVGKTLTQALLILNECGLEKGLVEYVEDVADRETVLMQSVPEGELVKPGSAVDLQISSGINLVTQAPIIIRQPQSLNVEQFEFAQLSVEAYVSDEGLLSYEWYSSVTGSSADFQFAGSGPVLYVDTSTPGTARFYCKVTNTQNDVAVSTHTDIVNLVVAASGENNLRTFRVPIPEAEEAMAKITVKMDGVNYVPPFEVARSEGSIQVEISATGTHTIDIYVDGILTVSSKADFH